MKISPQVKALTKGQIIDRAERDEAWSIMLECEYGNYGFDTNFEGVSLDGMHQCIEQAILDGEIEL